MFDRRIPFRPKEVDDDPVTERYKFDSDDERMEDDPDDHQVDLMTERAFLFSKARETDSAHAQAARRAVTDAPASNSPQIASASMSGQPPPHYRQ